MAHALLDTKRGRENKVIVPISATHAGGPHKYDRTIGPDGMVVGYVPISYEHQAYPRMLFHPSFGQNPEPSQQKFCTGAVTDSDYRRAFDSFNEAMNEWRRENRTVLAANAKDEKRLAEKGWLLQPPVHKDTKLFDLTSEEL